MSHDPDERQGKEIVALLAKDILFELGYDIFVGVSIQRRLSNEQKRNIAHAAKRIAKWARVGKNEP